jgi:hypothetical protein
MTTFRKLKKTAAELFARRRERQLPAEESTAAG